MLRVRLGTSWKQDPALRAALARGDAALVDAVMHGVDAIAIEIDGVDLFMGQAEGPVVPTLSSLGHGLLRLLDPGSPRAHVSFPEEELELVIGRRGASALLSLVRLRRPARVVVRDVEVELADLVDATRDAAGALGEDLRGLGAGALDPVARSLSSLARRLEAAHPLPPGADPDLLAAAEPEHGGGEDLPFCSFELSEDPSAFASYAGPGADLGSLLVPGRVLLRARDGQVLAIAEDAPFLVLRDLVAFAGRVASAVRGDGRASFELPATGRGAVVALHADVAAGTLAREGAPPLDCPPLLLARAACEAAIELTDRVLAWNPRQARNGWVTTLRTDASERIEQLDEILAGDVLSPHAGAVRRRRAPPVSRAPLGPGSMRRLVFRRAWSAGVGAPFPGAFALRGDLVLAAGSAAVRALDARTGAERWTRSGATAAWIGEGVFVAEPGRLVALDPATGRDRGAVELARLPHGAVRAVVRIAGGAAAALLPGTVAALDPGAGRVAWTFSPPAAIELRAIAFGPLLLVASDTGLLYGTDAATGRVRWRIHLPGPLAAPPIAFGESCVVACETDLGGALVAVDPATGRRAFEVSLDVTPTGAPVPFAGLLGVPGAVAGDALVTAVDPAGRLAWEDAAGFGPGSVALAALPSGLLAKTAGGACTALDRTGAPVWSRSARVEHPGLANPPPAVARGIALVASEQVDAIDARTGALLGRAPLPAPVALRCDSSLHAWSIDADGVVTAARLGTHLSLVG